MKKNLYTLILIASLGAGAVAAQEVPKANIAAAPTIKTAAAPSQQKPPTMEQVEAQLQSLYMEAGARVERIRVAQSELEQIKQSIEQLIAYKQQMAKSAPKADDGVTTHTGK